MEIEGIVVKYFNSHPHKEDDLIFLAKSLSIPISTHILTRRMTLVQMIQKRSVDYFNSHPHKEDDATVL